MADNDGQPQRKRARQACLACNARRVKCNVTETQPCHNCIAANVACETRESRRGKHPRPSKKRHSIVSTASDVQPPTNDQTQHADEVAGAHVLASLRDITNDGSNGEIPAFANHFQPEPQLLQQQDSRHEEDGDVFLGESSSLGYVPNETEASNALGISPPGAARLRHNVPNAIRAESLIPQWEVDRRATRLEILKKDGAFSLPAPHVVEGLLKAYFRWFHPCFAVVDEVDIWNQYRSGTLSILLLQSLLFVGVLHCDEDILESLGFGSRHRAKYVFYNHAKDIYDSEFERRKITVIQSLFLMSFWRAGALLEKDTRHWLGAAINLAQTKALHRSQGKAESSGAKLRRRIWWSLYTRDRQCAAALGLPNRIRDEDCDFEPLEVSDFDYAFPRDISKKDAEEYASYAVAMTELATLLGKVIHLGYLPNKSFNNILRHEMKEEIFRWKQRQPLAMQPDNDSEPGDPSSFHANMQHLAYNNLLILLYRHPYVCGEEDGREDGTTIMSAASRNSRIVEDMLSEGNLRHGQIHVITNLFNTLCIHTVQLRKSEGTTRTVAEHRAKLCLLGLQELQKTWEVTNWLLQLFFQYLDRATAARLQVQGDDYLTSTGVQPSRSMMQVPPVSAAMDFLSQSRPPSTIPAFDHSLPGSNDLSMPVTTPFSWTSEDANQYLFSQIENEFAFGEGEMLDWTGEDPNSLVNPFLQPTLNPNNFMQ